MGMKFKHWRWLCVNVSGLNYMHEQNTSNTFLNNRRLICTKVKLTTIKFKFQNKQNMLTAVEVIDGHDLYLFLQIEH